MSLCKGMEKATPDLAGWGVVCWVVQEARSMCGSCGWRTTHEDLEHRPKGALDITTKLWGTHERALELGISQHPKRAALEEEQED